MADLPESLFTNPVWHALHTEQRHFAVLAADACRYRGDVIPFAAVKSPSAGALEQLRAMLATGESVWIMGDSFPAFAGLAFEQQMPCLQMVLPHDLAVPETTIEIVPLGEAEAAEMVALTTLAFPGFFRTRTFELGSYYGVRSGGELIAMGGERMKLAGYAEISGVCTHPAHRGKGYAAGLMWQVALKHRRENVLSFLHVGNANQNAVELYLRMGFEVTRGVTIHKVSAE